MACWSSGQDVAFSARNPEFDPQTGYGNTKIILVGTKQKSL